MTRPEKFVKQSPLINSVEHLRKILATFPAEDRLKLYESIRDTLRPELKNIEDKTLLE